MVTAADRASQASFRRKIAGHAATALGGVVGEIGGAILGLNAGAWFGDRLTNLAELHTDAASFGFVVGASGGGAVIVLLLLRGSGLAAPGLTSLVFGAVVPAVWTALLLWEPAVDPSVGLGVVIGLTLLASVLSRAAAVRIARTQGSAKRRAMAAVCALWALGLLVVAVWLLSVDVVQPR
jgi:hypothetical protein